MIHARAAPGKSTSSVMDSWCEPSALMHAGGSLRAAALRVVGMTRST